MCEQGGFVPKGGQYSQCFEKELSKPARSPQIISPIGRDAVLDSELVEARVHNRMWSIAIHSHWAVWHLHPSVDVVRLPQALSQPPFALLVKLQPSSGAGGCPFELKPMGRVAFLPCAPGLAPRVPGVLVCACLLPGRC